MSDSARAAKPDVFAPPVVKSVPLQDRPRDAEFAWLREQAQDYNGQWVVLDGATLIASGPNFRDILRLLTPEQRERDPLFHRVDLD